MFSVEGVRVTLDAYHGWRCACASSRADIQCAHIEQALRLKRLREERRAADTVELELTAEQLRALSEGLDRQQPDAVPNEHVPPPPQRKPSGRRRTTLVAAAVAISILSSGITYLAVKDAEPTGAAEQPLSAFRIDPEPQPAQAPQADVHFVNPFDATEIFQFPPGTSESSAREAVAELLLKRAQERLATAAPPATLRIAQSTNSP